MADDTADIVVRGLDEGFVRRIRADMALRGQSLKEWIEQACTARLAEGFALTDLGSVEMHRKLEG